MTIRGFWYRNDLRGSARELILVEAENGKREPAFDHDKLAEVLSKAAEKSYKADATAVPTASSHRR